MVFYVSKPKDFQSYAQPTFVPENMKHLETVYFEKSHLKRFSGSVGFKLATYNLILSLPGRFTAKDIGFVVRVGENYRIKTLFSGQRTLKMNSVVPDTYTCKY